MAAPQCMSQDGRPAVFVGTMLETGDGFTLCADCLQGWAAAVVAGLLGIDADLFQRTVLALADDVQQAEADQELDAGMLAANTAAGAPTDQPPAPAPADPDTATADPPTNGSKAAGRSRPKSGDPPTGTETETVAATTTVGSDTSTGR